MRELTHTIRTHARRQIREKFISKPIGLALDLISQQVSSEEAYPTVDVKANTSRGDDTFLSIGCSNTADRKPIAPVDIWHGERIANNAWQGCHICHLL